MNDIARLDAVTTRAPPVAGPARAAAGEVGALVREWRSRRRRSQLDLALQVGVSPRHLSFIETGRSTPSTAMVLALADGLDLPLRERNRLLLAAGHAPRFGERAFASAELGTVRAALQRLLEAHHPYPGLVLDRQWNVVLANRAAEDLVGLLAPGLRDPVLNVFRASLHPDGLAGRTANFEEWGGYLLAQLRRLVETTQDAGLGRIEREVLGYPNVAALAAARAGDAPPGAAQPLLVPCVLELPAGRVSLFTTLTTFGTPRDVLLDELCIELFYPADGASEALLRGASAGPVRERDTVEAVDGDGGRSA